MENTDVVVPIFLMLYIKNFNLKLSLAMTKGYNTIFLPWLYGHRTGWNITTFNQLSPQNRNIFLYFIHSYFSCIGVGLEDWTQGYSIYDELYDSNIILTLLLQISLAIKTNLSTDITPNHCWFTNTEPNEDYLYIKASKTINGKKKTFRVKAIRLLCGIFQRPCLTNRGTTNSLQCSHLCFMEPSCVNPYHLWPETDIENKSRISCKNGCAHYCPHNPKCIWTWYNGQELPHRNNHRRAYSKSDCNCTDVNCFF